MTGRVIKRAGYISQSRVVSFAIGRSVEWRVSSVECFSFGVARKSLATRHSPLEHSLRLPAGDGGDDGDFVALFDRGRFVVEETDVLVVEKHVDETADVAVFIADALFESGIGLIEVLDQFADVCAAGLDEFLFPGEFAQWSWDADGCHGFGFGFLNHRGTEDTEAYLE